MLKLGHFLSFIAFWRTMLNTQEHADHETIPLEQTLPQSKLSGHNKLIPVIYASDGIDGLVPLNSISFASPLSAPLKIFSLPF